MLQYQITHRDWQFYSAADSPEMALEEAIAYYSNVSGVTLNPRECSVREVYITLGFSHYTYLLPVGMYDAISE